MAEHRLFYRRLYHAKECNPPPSGNFAFGVPTADSVHVETYVGSQPQLPLRFEMPENGPAIPGQPEATVLTGTVLGDAETAESPNGVYVEIFCSQPVNTGDRATCEVSDPERSEPVPDWQRADALLPRLSETADVVAGLIGLKFSPLLVRNRLADVLIWSAGETSFCRVDTGPFSAVAFPVPTLDDEQLGTLRGWLSGLASFAPEAIPDTARALRWLMRTWRARSGAELFVDLYTTMEILCHQVKPGPDPSRQSRFDRIRSLIDGVGDAEEKKELAEFLNVLDLRTRGVPIRQRFRDLASAASFPEDSCDREAFDRFSRMRNDMVHGGREATATEITLSDETVTSFRRMVERYVASSVFGSERSIYDSSHQSSGTRIHLFLGNTPKR